MLELSLLRSALLEAGDREPSPTTLNRLARGPSLEPHIGITADAFGLRDTA